MCKQKKYQPAGAQSISEGAAKIEANNPAPVAVDQRRGIDLKGGRE
jgi:hypothetical protein